jgi:tetratricopeptide (TPR) repeat protein
LLGVFCAGGGPAPPPRYPFLAVEYGLALAVLGRTEEAKKLYLAAAESNQARERVYACGILGEQAMMEGKRDEAILWLKRGLEIAPGDARLTEMLQGIEGPH